MKLARICVVSLGSVALAFAFGVVANAAIDIMMPAGPRQAPAVAPAPVKAAEEAAPATFTVASATASPVELGPVKVKTLPIVVRDGQFAVEVNDAAAAVVAHVPLPRPRPASAPTSDVTASVARQPASMAIAAATRKANPDDGEMLSAAGIDRMKMALALTAEQEEYWPAIAAELRALGKALKTTKGHAANINLDGDTMQRLYYAAAPLISRLSYEQKQKVKQMAHVMGLHQVAQAL
jgi:hypothetical protein